MALFYAATTGSDAAAGTIGAPWLTPRFAVAQLNAGDTLYIRGGTYTDATCSFNTKYGLLPSGTSYQNAVTIAAYPSETVIIQPPDGVSGIFFASMSSYMIFQDLIIDMINQADNSSGNVSDGVFVSAGTHHIRFLRLEVKNNAASGYHFSNNNGTTHHLDIIGGSSHDHQRSNTVLAGYGMYIGSSDCLIDGVDIYNCNGGGIQSNVLGAPDGQRGIIRNCKIHDNVTVGTIQVVGSSGFGIAILAHTIGGADSWQVYNNLIYHNGHGNAFGSASLGIYIYNNQTNCHFYNNTIYDNTGDGFFMEYYGDGNVIANNIIFANGGQAIGDYGFGTQSGVPPLQIANLINVDPLFVNAGAGDFHLLTGSPAKNAGVTLVEVPVDKDGAARPQGTAYCIGAYEFLGGGGGGAGTFTFVNSKKGTGTGTTPTDTSMAVAAGDLIAVAIANADNTGPYNVIDTAGDVFTKVPNSRIYINSTFHVEWWYCLASAGHASMIVTGQFVDGGTTVEIQALAYSYTAGTAPSFDTQATTTATGVSSISLTITPSQANALILAVAQNAGIRTYVVGASCTLRQLSGYEQQSEDRLNGAVGAQTVAISWTGGTVDCAFSVAAFSLSGGGGGSFQAAGATCQALIGSGIY